MFETTVSDNVRLDWRAPFDCDGVVHVGRPSRRKDLVSKLSVVERAFVPRVKANSILIFAAQIFLIQAKTVQKDAAQLSVAGTSAKVPSDPSIKDLRNTNEQMMGRVLRRELGEFLVNGVPEITKPMAFPQVKDGGSLHLAVRAYGSPLRVIVPLLLSITPVGLQMQPDERRPEALVNSAKASVIKRSINVPTMAKHGPGSSYRA
jgi:hypothetical protein